MKKHFQMGLVLLVATLSLVFTACSDINGLFGSAGSIQVRAVYVAWQAGTSYKTGDLVTYSGNNYQCLQAHTALDSWEPSNVPALWKNIGVASGTTDPILVGIPGWTVYGGTWTSSGVTFAVAADPGAKLIANQPVYTDFDLDADIKVGVSGNAGLIFRVSNPSVGTDSLNGYYIGIDAGASRLQLGKMNNNWTELKNVSFAVAANTAYHVKVNAVGSRLRIFVTDMTTPKMDISDSSFSSGLIGLRTYRADAQFANIAASVINNNSGTTGPVRTGEMTYYGPESGSTTDVPGNCGGYTTDDLLAIGMDFCAMQTTDLMGEQLMGGCIEVTGPSGKKANFVIVDKLPSGVAHNVDIYGRANFAKLENPDLGRLNVQWHLVALPKSGNIQYRFQAGSTRDWAALQIFNHKYPIQKVEYRNSIGNYVQMQRQSDGGNFFIGTGMGDGSYTLRLTDYFGHVVVDGGIQLQSASRQSGSAQFP